MTQDIMLDSSAFAIPVASEKRGEDSKEALAVSLQKLEEIADAVAREEISGSKGSDSSADLESVVNSIRDVLVKNPAAFDDVLKLIAPQTQTLGKELLGKVADAKKLVEKFAEEVSGVDKETFAKEFDERVAPLLVGYGSSQKALKGICDEMKPFLETLNSSDPTKFEEFLKGLIPVITLVSIRNPEKAKEIMKGFTKRLASTYELPVEGQKKFFKSLQSNLVTLSKPEAPSVESLTSDKNVSNLLKNYADAGAQNSPDMSGNLAQVMMILQMFQMALSQNQINQNNIQNQISNAAIKAAQENQKNVADEIAKANAEAEKAAHRPWWETLVEVVVSVVAVCVAALTGGIGAAFVAVAVGAFMASPGFNDSVKALGDVLTKALESAGMGHSEAKALGDMLAKVIIIVVIAVASAGVGGIGAASDAAADTAASAAADAGADAAASGTSDAVATGATDAAADEASSVMKSIKSIYKYITKPFNMGVRGKIFTFELVSNLATSGVWMDGMEMDPGFVKKHPKLVEALNILATIIGVIVSMLVGAKSMSGMSSGKTLLERLPSWCKGAIPLNYAMQVGNSGWQSYLSYQSGKFLETEARVTREIGQSEANVVSANGILNFVSDSTKTVNDSSTSVVNNIAEEMSLLCNNSGAIWKETSKVLAG
jgi:hypothetical protein